jgi:hypothetical protein
MSAPFRAIKAFSFQELAGADSIAQNRSLLSGYWAAENIFEKNHL